MGFGRQPAQLPPLQIERNLLGCARHQQFRDRFGNGWLGIQLHHRHQRGQPRLRSRQFTSRSDLQLGNRRHHRFALGRWNLHRHSVRSIHFVLAIRHQGSNHHHSGFRSAACRGNTRELGHERGQTQGYGHQHRWSRRHHHRILGRQQCQHHGWKLG